MATRFSVLSIFKAGDRITAPVRKMTASISRMTRSIGRGFARANRSVKKFTSALKSAALIGVASLLSIGAAIKNLVLSGADFGRAIGSAAAKFPDKIKRGTKAFNDLVDSAREVGATTEFTATQAARGLNFLAKAGFNAAFSMRALPKIVDFATASELEFAEAADIASDALGAFGLDSDDLGKKMMGLDRVMDVLSLTANSANADVTQLFESVKKGAPVAAAAGQTIETYSSILGFLAANGIKASEAGTAVKNVTLALTGIGNKAGITLKRLGIRLQDNNGDLRDQLDVLDDLRGALKGFGEKKRLTIIESIFGKLSLAAATKLLDKSGKSVRAFRSELEKAGGSSKRTAAFIRNDVKGSIDGLISSIEGVKISIFTLNEGPLKGAIDSMTLWVRENEKLIATNIGGFLANLIENFENIVRTGRKIAGVITLYIALTAALKIAQGVVLLFNIAMGASAVAAAIVGGAITAYTAVVTLMPKALRAAQIAMVLLNLAMFANPVGLVVAGITALVAIAAVVIAAWDPVTEFFSDLFETIKGVISGIGGAISRFGAIFGFTESKGGDSAAPQVAGPQERAARIIQENRTTNTTEVTIRDETGRAEITGSSIGAALKLEQSGAF